MASSPASVAIDVAEESYSLETPDADWLRSLIAKWMPGLPENAGTMGMIFDRHESGGIMLVDRQLSEGVDDVVLEHHGALFGEMPDRMQERLFRPGVVGTVSALTQDIPEAMEIVEKHLGPLGMHDGLGVTAMDPDGRGVVLLAGLSERQALAARSLHRWKRLAIHLTAGFRVRSGLRGAPGAGVPLDGEAVVDPKRFGVTHAKGDAKETSQLEALRDAAKAVDRARGPLRKSDPDEALDIWKGLVSGRWSLVDWFDSDGRRFIIARPNAPDVPDPRALTPRQRQIVAFAIAGETHKEIAYRLGLATGTVSANLTTAMHKLGVKTQTELIAKLRPAS